MGKQVEKLANFIMHECDGEPSVAGGAVDVAIHIITKQRMEIEFLSQRVLELQKNQADAPTARMITDNPQA